METTNGNKNGGLAKGDRLAFDDFEVDPTNRLVLCAGDVVPLTGKVFDLLLAFVENPGRLLDKEELIEKVWPSDFVEEGNLARNVSTLRKALGDHSKDHKYIATVQGRGYRFISAVQVIRNEEVSATDSPSVVKQMPAVTPMIGGRHFALKWPLTITLAVLIAFGVWTVREQFRPPTGQIKSLAVLPLRSLNKGENYLGLGIADAVIRKISQTAKVTVRPTSAVRRYLTDDVDALTAARQLESDAVLEGSVLREGDRLRVSVNLLRTSDGVSLWTDSFDVQATDIFVIQDSVSQEVVRRLREQLDSSKPADKRYTSNTLAYDFYLRGIYNLDLRGDTKDAKRQMDSTIEYLKKAVEADPNFALAHARLGYAYAWTGIFIDTTDTNWARLADEEIRQSLTLDPGLAEAHVANALLLWSSYKAFQNEAAVRELLLAQQLDPGVGRTELAAIYQHIGLETLAASELQRALEIDPTSKTNNDLILINDWLAGRFDSWLADIEKLKPGSPVPAEYLLRKGRLDEAERAIDEIQSRSPDDPELPALKALLFALRGDFRAAEGEMPNILAKRPPNHMARHHATYDIACAYALEGKGEKAVEWLRETAATGFPDYPRFEREPFFDGIRQSPEFIQFIGEQKVEWERLRREMNE